MLQSKDSKKRNYSKKINNTDDLKNSDTKTLEFFMQPNILKKIIMVEQ